MMTLRELSGEDPEELGHWLAGMHIEDDDELDEVLADLDELATRVLAIRNRRRQGGNRWR